MNIALWIIQVLAGIVFFMAGAMKVAQSKEKLEARMAWMADFSVGQIRTIGILEILGALGLVLPPLTGILPWLAVVAAIGLALDMIGAALTHLRHGELPNIAVNLVLFALVVVVAYGRFLVVPL